MQHGCVYSLTMASITDREAAVYDRQIRLWGLEAQKRLQNSRILICGMRGLGAEVAKNLALAGFGVTVQDSSNVCDQDLGANFFISADQVGKNRAVAALEQIKELNPLVETQSLSTSLADIDEATLGPYNCVLLTNHAPLPEQIRLNALCRKVGVNFFVGDTYGTLGVLFADLGPAFECKAKAPAKQNAGENTEAPVFVDKTIAFPNLEKSLSSPWKDLMNRRFGTPSLYFGVLILHRFEKVVGRPIDSSKEEDLKTLMYISTDMAVEQGESREDGAAGAFIEEDLLRLLWQTARVELSPVCAVLGGMIGQEIVKVIARKGKPLWESGGGNWIFLDTMGMTDQRGGAVVKSIPPI